MPEDEVLDLMGEVKMLSLAELFAARPIELSLEQRKQVIIQIRADRAAQLEKRASGSGRGQKKAPKIKSKITGIDLNALVEDLTLPGLDE